MAKHVILRKYLNAWLPKQTKYNKRVIICDGFAGPGVYKGGEDGSPIIALKAFTEHSFREQISADVIYLFIESRPDRFKSLTRVLEPFEELLPDNVRIYTYNEDYDSALVRILDRMDRGATSIAPTFAFIDPFGIKGVSLSTLRRLMTHKGCEVFVNFMMSSLQRFLETKEFEGNCDNFFGCPDWRDALPLSGAERENTLRLLYQRRLRDRDGVAAQYVRFFTMTDRNKAAIYDLFFATNHAKGIDAMKDAMWSVDPGGDYTFSDATNPEQEVLFEPEPDWPKLIDTLVAKFQGQFKIGRAHV